MNKKGLVLVLFIILIGLFNVTIIYLEKNKLVKDFINIKYSNDINENKEYIVTVEYKSKNNKDVVCSLDNINYKNIDECTFNLKKGEYNLYLRKNNKVIKEKFKVEEKFLGTFSSTIDVLDTYYLAVNGKKKFNFTFDYKEDFDKTVYYEITNTDVLKIENDTMYGLKTGTSEVIATLKDGNTKTYNIVVTDLITPPTINNDKYYLPCNYYSLEESILLDKILESRVMEAGIGTRAGVAAAARFLSLEFPYSIAYFNENGRLAAHGTKPRVDAEGRYYHKGLYLHTSKFEGLDKSAITSGGPNIWGCNVYDKFISSYRRNGLTCSGFVTWAMLNGGFETGDVGAGDTSYLTDELSDLGPHNILTYDFMKNGDYQVGDFIADDGHAALIIGIDDNYIYTAESLLPKLMVYKYGRYKEIVDGKLLTYTINMKNIYPNGNGNLTNIWE